MIVPALAVCVAFQAGGPAPPPAGLAWPSGLGVRVLRVTGLDPATAARDVRKIARGRPGFVTAVPLGRRYLLLWADGKTVDDLITFLALMKSCGGSEPAGVPAEDGPSCRAWVFAEPAGCA